MAVKEVSVESIFGLAAEHGSGEAYSSGGLRRDFSFNGSQLITFAQALLEMQRKSPDAVQIVNRGNEF